MSTLEIHTEPNELAVVSTTQELTAFETVQELSIQLDENELTVSETIQQLDIINDAPTLDLTVNQSTLEGVLDALTINQYFSGEGAVADQDTILGLGTTASPLEAPDMLRITQRLAEFNTAPAKIEARDNLGLNVIDGGTFT